MLRSGKKVFEALPYFSVLKGEVEL
jgi:hypothetical protein